MAMAALGVMMMMMMMAYREGRGVYQNQAAWGPQLPSYLPSHALLPMSRMLFIPFSFTNFIHLAAFCI